MGGRFVIGALALSLSACSVRPAPEMARTAPAERAEQSLTVHAAPVPEDRKGGCGDIAVKPDDWFEPAATLPFRYQDGRRSGLYTLLETVGGGAALFDFDRDGDLDLFVTGGGTIADSPPAIRGSPSGLFRNDGAWHFTDVTREMQIDTAEIYTHGCSVGDYDRDGFPDLCVTGYRGLFLFHNEGGTRFRNVAPACGIDGSRTWNTAAAWADYDRDGNIDLFVATYADWPAGPLKKCIFERRDGIYQDTCAPTDYVGEPDLLFRNLGAGEFADVSGDVGLVSSTRGLGVLASDLDEDGWIDFFVTNDVHENELYFGSSAGSFTQEGMLAGVACSPAGEREGSMGLDVGDFDGDGAPDLFYTNYADQDNALLRRIQPRGWLNVTAEAGLLGKSRRWVGFGTKFVDVDHDGWLDLFVSNGHVQYSAPAAYDQPPQLFRNQDGRTYREESTRGGCYFAGVHTGRGVAVGDIDGDGADDIVVVHQDEPVVLLRNRRPPPNRIHLRLRGANADPDAIGAKIQIPYGDRTLTRFATSGGGYLSHSDPAVVTPLPTAEAIEVTVIWLGGRTEKFGPLQANQRHELVEGHGRSF